MENPQKKKLRLDSFFEMPHVVYTRSHPKANQVLLSASSSSSASDCSIIDSLGTLICANIPMDKSIQDLDWKQHPRLFQTAFLSMAVCQRFGRGTLVVGDGQGNVQYFVSGQWVGSIHLQAPILTLAVHLDAGIAFSCTHSCKKSSGK